MIKVVKFQKIQVGKYFNILDKYEEMIQNIAKINKNKNFKSENSEEETLFSNDYSNKNTEICLLDKDKLNEIQEDSLTKEQNNFNFKDKDYNTKTRNSLQIKSPSLTNNESLSKKILLIKLKFIFIFF